MSSRFKFVLWILIFAGNLYMLCSKCTYLGKQVFLALTFNPGHILGLHRAGFGIQYCSLVHCGGSFLIEYHDNDSLSGHHYPPNAIRANLNRFFCLGWSFYSTVPQSRLVLQQYLSGPIASLPPSHFYLQVVIVI